MIQEVRGFIRIIDESTGAVAPVRSIAPIGTENGLYVRVVSTPSDVTSVIQSITTFDVASLSHIINDNQIAYTGTPTAGSAASFAFNSYETIIIQVSGIWSGKMLTEISVDNNVTWYPANVNLFDEPSILFNSFTQNFLGSLNVSGKTNFRIRTMDIDFAGIVNVKIIETRSSSNGVNLLGINKAIVTNFPKTQDVKDVNANDVLWMILDELRSMNEERGIFSDTNQV